MLNVVALGGSVIGEFYFHHIFSKFSVINMILLYTEKQIYKKKKIGGSIQGTELVLV